MSKTEIELRRAAIAFMRSITKSKTDAIEAAKVLIAACEASQDAEQREQDEERKP
jgi:hypothetical protein